MATVHPECSICYDAVIDHPAPEGVEATGSHRSSCGHLFHPKCIAKWHVRQEESTCPNCRKKAVEMEDCAPEEENEEGDEEEDEEGDGYVGGTIRITWRGMDELITSQGGTGVTPGVEEDVGFDEHREAIITRYDFERILRLQGIGPFSDARWLQLQSIYPADDEDDEEVVGGVIRLSRAGLEFILRQAGGVGVTAGVEAEVEINEFNEVVIERFELERILREQGGTPLSDAQWTQLTSVYPPAEYNDDDEVVAGAMAMVGQPQLTFAPSADDEPEIADPTQRARALLANPEPPASVVTPEDREAWALVLDSARATIARHAASLLAPDYSEAWDLVVDSAHATITRHGTSALAATIARHATAAAAAGASWLGLGGRWRWLTPYQYHQHPCPLELFAARDIPPTYVAADSVRCDICKIDVMRTAFYHCRECEFDVCAECFMPPALSAVEEVVHAPGPFDFVDGEEGHEGQWITLTRQAIQHLLLSHGSMATMVEFFNEEGEPPTEQTLVVTMSLESLNCRFASLGATPVTFAEVQTAVTTPPPSPSASPSVDTCIVCGCTDRVRCSCNACFSGCDRHASYGDALERSVARSLLSIAAPRQSPLQVTAFADGTRQVVVKPRVILNPEDE